jgi:hypothetical protein
MRLLRRKLDMKSASVSLPPDAFARPDAGFDYFGTVEHYQFLARSIVDTLCRGSLVLVTGDPAPGVPMLAEALRKAAPSRQVIEIPCGPDLDHKQLFRGASTDQETALDESSGARAPATGPGSPVFVFGDADRLSDVQIKDLLEAAQSPPPELQGPQAAVILARPAFLDRFESPLLHFLKDGFAARLSAQHLDSNEVEAFIRHQLPAESGSNFLTAQRAALIAITSGGDPAVVNRLARRMMEIEPSGRAGIVPGRTAGLGPGSPPEPIPPQGAGPHLTIRAGMTEDEDAAAIELATWFTPAEAAVYAAKVVGPDDAQPAIWARLQGGLIRAVATSSSATLQGRPPVLRTGPSFIPKDHWDYFTTDRTGPNFWRSGDARFFLPRTESRNLPLTISCFGIKLDPADVRATLPPPPPAPDQPEPTTEIAATAEEAEIEPQLPIRGPPVSDEHLRLWHALYQQVYQGSQDTLATAYKSAVGMFPGKFVSRDRVRKLCAGRKIGRKSSRS